MVVRAPICDWELKFPCYQSSETLGGFLKFGRKLDELVVLLVLILTAARAALMLLFIFFLSTKFDSWKKK